MGPPPLTREASRKTLVTIFREIGKGSSPDLKTLPDDIAAPLRSLVKDLRKRDRVDLATTVDFSLQASESMAAVSRITGDIRDIDHNAQMMASAIEQLNASINQISETARQSSTQMQEASSLVARGTENVRNTAAAAQKTSKSMTLTEQEANNVVEAVEQITTFIATIDAIAQQTNLLALNATIEAARAGEAGKGFAVVAAEVKTLSNQTQKATEDISNLIGTLQTAVGRLAESVEMARSSVTSAQELTASAEQHISAVNEIVQQNSERMDVVANVLSEQSKATGELAGGVSKIAERSGVAAERANHVIEAVHNSEALIEKKFEFLDNRDIEDYVLYRAKSDHFLWKKRLSEMLVGLNNLTEDELADHHSCRLGKWYDAVSDDRIRNHPAYIALKEPHAAVHSHGKKAAALFAAGNTEAAHAAVADMERASQEVVRLLEELINR